MGTAEESSSFLAQERGCGGSGGRALVSVHSPRVLLRRPVVLQAVPGVEHGFWRPFWHLFLEARGVIKGVIEDDCVPDADVLQGVAVLVERRLVHALQAVETLGDLAEYRVLFVQRREVRGQGHVELGAVAILRQRRHPQEAFPLVSQLRSNFIVEMLRRREDRAIQVTPEKVLVGVTGSRGRFVERGRICGQESRNCIPWHGRRTERRI